MFDILVWAGAALSVAGRIGLFWCILYVIKARRKSLDDEALRAVVQSVLPYILGALFLSGHWFDAGDDRYFARLISPPGHQSQRAAGRRRARSNFQSVVAGFLAIRP